MNLTDQQAIEFMKLYKIKQKDVAERLGITKGTMSITYNRMKNGTYINSQRGAVDRAKQAIVEILEEKGIIFK